REHGQVAVGSRAAVVVGEEERAARVDRSTGGERRRPAVFGHGGRGFGREPVGADRDPAIGALALGAARLEATLVDARDNRCPATMLQRSTILLQCNARDQARGGGGRERQEAGPPALPRRQLRPTEDGGGEVPRGGRIGAGREAAGIAGE